MKLFEGQRLSGPGRSLYQVDCLHSETPWYRLYEARKVFHNFRYDDREIYETSEDEWIDVLVRVSAYPDGVLPAEVEKRRKLLRYETTEVLSASLPWFPQAIDWLEVAIQGEAPGGALTGRHEPVLVLSRSQGSSLRAWRRQFPAPTADCLNLCAETARLLADLHRRGQCVGGWGPDDFLIDSTGRLFFLATDRVVSSEAPEWLREFYPPSRYPACYAAPEVLQPDGVIDASSDRYTWAALCQYLLTSEEPAAHDERGDGSQRSEGPDDSKANSGPPLRPDPALDGLKAALEKVVDNASDPMPEPPWFSNEWTGNAESTLAQRWTECVAGCLQTSREARSQWSDVQARESKPPASLWSRLLRRG